MYDKYNKTKQN